MRALALVERHEATVLRNRQERLAGGEKHRKVLVELLPCCGVDLTPPVEGQWQGS